MPNKQPDWRKATDYPKNCTADRWSYEFELRGAPKLRFQFPSEAIPEYARKALGIDAPVMYAHGPHGLVPTVPNEQGQQFAVLPLDYHHRRHIINLFFLDDDLDDQIERARKSLKSLQKDLYSIPSVRRRFEKYPSYLRLIDAKNTGATKDEMAKFIFPEVANEYPDYLARKRVENGLKAAEKIIKKGVKPLFARKEK